MPWLALIGNAFKALAAALGLIDKANERTAGVNQERATENAATAKVNEDVAKAAVASDPSSILEQLRSGRG